MHQSRYQRASCSCCSFLRPGDGARPVGKLIATGQVDVWDNENIIITDFD
jgi:hypothetical protein